MRLVDRIEGAGMPVEVLAAFRAGLEQVAGASRFASMEHAVLSGLFERILPPDTEAASFEDLWPYAELFVTAALVVTVSGGRYGVEEARVIGAWASRLGCSASGLAAIEDRVFTELQSRGRALREPGPA